MINFNNNNITGISYNNHSIKYVYGCGGNLVWSGDTPTPPVGDYKWLATYSDSHTESAECGASSAITQDEINATNLISVEIGDCVTWIGGRAFVGCSGLTSVTIPNSVTAIDVSAFASCDSLSSVTIGNSVTNIGGYAFALCSLTSLTIPNSVTSFGEYAFQNCRSLSSVTIGSGVTSIGYRAFLYCTGLISVTCLATTPPTLSADVFKSTNNCPIYVPDESVDTYKTADGWSTYAGRIKPISEKP